jgi:hypothetical protein
MRNNLLPSLFILFALLGSCTFTSEDYEIKSITGNPEMAVPLATGKLTIKDILNKSDSSYIRVYPDELVYLSYEETLVTQDIRDLVAIPDLSTVNRTLNFQAGTQPPSNIDINSTVSSSAVDMGIFPERLTEIEFKSGKLNYATNLVPSSGIQYAIRIRIPEFTNGAGAAFQQTVTGAGSFSLIGYTFKSNTPNTFTLEHTLIIKQHTNSYTVSAGTNVNVSVSMDGLNFKYIRGFFNDQTANPAQETLDIGTLGDFLEEGTVSFAQPKIQLSVISDYGVPLEVTFTTLQAEKQGSSLPIVISPASPVNINQPAALGLSATTTVNITNVNELFAFGPSQFRYMVSGRINKGLTSGNNFMADTSKMRVRMNVELPLYGKASDIVLEDTLELDLGDLKKSEIQSAGIKAVVRNELPLDAAIQLILLNSSNQSLGQLISPAQTNFVKGSTVNPAGDLQTPGTFDGIIDLDNVSVNKIFEAKFLVIKATLNTSKSGAGQVDVKFKSKLAIDVKLGLKVKLKLTAEL